VLGTSLPACNRLSIKKPARRPRRRPRRLARGRRELLQPTISVNAVHSLAAWPLVPYPQAIRARLPCRLRHRAPERCRPLSGHGGWWCKLVRPVEVAKPRRSTRPQPAATPASRRCHPAAPLPRFQRGARAQPDGQAWRWRRRRHSRRSTPPAPLAATRLVRAHRWSRTPTHWQSRALGRSPVGRTRWWPTWQLPWGRLLGRASALSSRAAGWGPARSHGTKYRGSRRPAVNRRLARNGLTQPIFYGQSVTWG
jgi:hypothetical protein